MMRRQGGKCSGAHHAILQAAPRPPHKQQLLPAPHSLRASKTVQNTVATTENLPLTGPDQLPSVSVQLVRPSSSSRRRAPSGVPSRASREVSFAGSNSA